GIIGKAAALLAGVLMAAPVLAANQPYTSASYVNGAGVDEVASDVKAALNDVGLTVQGSYHPAGQPNMVSVEVTDSRLLSAIGQLGQTTAGGYPIFGAGIRVGIYQNTEDDSDEVEVSFANPTYWYNAYFQDAYQQVASEAERVEDTLMDTLASARRAARPSGARSRIWPTTTTWSSCRISRTTSSWPPSTASTRPSGPSAATSSRVLPIPSRSMRW
ncbi:MAG: hypothetical protein ABEJ96_10550, partial [Thiohalorhabdaceae bacterium]